MCTIGMMYGHELLESVGMMPAELAAFSFGISRLSW